MPPTLDSTLLDHQCCMEGGDLKNAKLFNNCIEYPLLTYHCHRYVVPCNDVYMHAIQHIIGLYTRYQKIFTLFEEACHQLDLKLAMHWKVKSFNSSEYEAYSSRLSK